MKPERYKNIFAWADESGNSGLNVFDTGQPMFWSGTLIAPVDIDSAPSPHAEWLGIADASELHGKELGLGGLNTIANSIREFLQKLDCRFVFTRADKEFHVVSTFVTMVFDSDVNEAVLPIYDQVPVFRKNIARDLMQVFPSVDRREFWAAFAGRDLARFSQLLLNLELRVRESLEDKRSVELICEAFRWARTHPANIMEARLSHRDSPNARALLHLVDGVHKLVGRTARVVRFRHDEQPEFEQILKEDFELIKNAFGPLGSQYVSSRANPAEVFECQLEMLPSHASLGLQLIDVLLYLMSRHLNGSYVPREDACGELLNYLRADGRGIINQVILSPKEFSFAELEQMAASSSLCNPGASTFEDIVNATKGRILGL